MARRIEKIECEPATALPPRRYSWSSKAVLLALALVALVCVAPGVARAAQGAHLDQCANGAPGAVQSCPPGWQNGDLNANNSHYRELDSVPFRLVLTSLTSGTHTVIVQYDTLQSDKHAYDYLTTYNLTVAGANPCDGVAGTCAAGGAFDIPLDPLFASSAFGTALPQGSRQLSIWNGTITGIVAGGGSDAAGQQSYTVTFTSSSPTVVLAWGGHVGSQVNWGPGNGAGAIPGSPYHMRLIGLDGKGGNQDRSMKASSILPPPPTFTTDPSSGAVSLGATVTDTASLTASQSGGPVTGTASFFVCYSLTGYPDCAVSNMTAASVGGAVTIVNGAAQSPAFSPQAVGFYCFRAQYTPDNAAFYSPTVETNQTQQSAGNHGECFTVIQPTGTLTVIKHVVNDNGGTATASQWSMHVAAGGADVGGSPFAGAESPGTTRTVNAGSYSIGESGGPSGYAATFSGDCDAHGNVTVTQGSAKTCTVVNDDQAAHLIVVKHVVNDSGASASASAFALTIGGVTAVGGQTVTGTESPGVDKTLGSVGAYTVTEGTHAGYDVSYSADCSATIGLGETKTCTVVNNDVAAHLIVVKHVVNDNGGSAAAGDFSLTIGGVTAAGGQSVTGTESPGADKTLTGVGSYTVTEGAHAGYDVTYSADCSATIALGQTKTCTVVNNDRAAHLIVVKHVVNDDGGSAAASAFSLTIGGVTAAGGQSVTGAESPGVDRTLSSVGSYTVTEGVHAGYDVSYSADCSATIALGETKTCTVVNDDVAAHLIVVKHVVNDNGGSAAASAFTLTIGGVTAAGGQSVTGAESPGVDKALTSAGAYTVTEGAHPGYDVTYSADCSATIALGETKTCTVTNDDRAAHLIVVKHVVNDNGATSAAGDFTLTIGGVTAAGGQAVTGAESPGVDRTLTSVGSYTVTEGAHAGYDVSYSADCSATVALGETKTCTVTNNDLAAHLIVVKHVVNDNGGSAAASAFALTIGGVTAAGGQSVTGAESPGVDKTLTSVGSYAVTEAAHAGYDVTYSADCNGTVALGETKTCTVVNDDRAAHLIVVKHVVNDNGGSAAANAFTLTIGGVTAAGGQAVTGTESPGVDRTLTGVGSYTVTEGAHAGYDVSYSADCSATVALGETKTCTVTNNDVAPQLHLRKLVTNDNGGSAAATAWTLTATGSNEAATNLSGPSPVDSGSSFRAGTYTLAESGGPSGYTAGAWSCLNGTAAVAVNGSSVAVGLGDNVTCTIVNDDVAPKLTVIKHVVNDDGGTATAGSFTLSVTGGTPSPASFAGSESGTVVTLKAGSYSVSEAAKTGYASSLSADCSGSIAVGETKTCTVTNNDVVVPSQQPPPATPPPPVTAVPPRIDLAVTKTDSPDPDTLGQKVTYTMVVTNNGPDTATNVQLADPLPANVTFVSVATTRGACTGGAVIACALGTMPSGQTATITLVTKPTATGTVFNTVTVVGAEAETNTANNTANATTLVTAPFTPPAVKPVVKPSCIALAVSPKSLTVGRASTLNMRVSTAKKAVKGARVHVKGAGIDRMTGRTNAQGKTSLKLVPKRPGIVRIAPAAGKGCSTPRVGIIGAFTPPVTG